MRRNRTREIPRDNVGDAMELNLILLDLPGKCESRQQIRDGDGAGGLAVENQRYVIPGLVGLK